MFLQALEHILLRLARCSCCHTDSVLKWATIRNVFVHARCVRLEIHTYSTLCYYLSVSPQPHQTLSRTPQPVVRAASCFHPRFSLKNLEQHYSNIPLFHSSQLIHTGFICHFTELLEAVWDDQLWNSISLGTNNVSFKVTISSTTTRTMHKQYTKITFSPCFPPK